MIELCPEKMNKVHRPFNLEQARQGAPVGLRGGTSRDPSVRIICWDAENNLCPIIALVRANKGIANEDVYVYSKDGTSMGRSGSRFYDLVMAPIGQVEGTDVYWGDKVYGKKTGRLYVISKNWPGQSAAQILQDYTIKPPTVMFRDRELGMDSELWYQKESKDAWVKVKASESWTANAAVGIDTSHFGFIQANIERPHLLSHYSWDFPVEVKVEGKLLAIGDKVWFKHNPAEDPIVIDEKILPVIARGAINAKALTRRPWIKKTNWQAEVSVDFGDAPASDPILLGPLFSSETECIEKGPEMIPPGYKFVAAKVASSYYM